MEAAAFYGKNNAGGQISLFAAAQIEEPQADMVRCEEYSQGELLKFEYEALGFYLTGHPLQQYAPLAKKDVYKRQGYRWEPLYLRVCLFIG